MKSLNLRIILSLLSVIFSSSLDNRAKADDSGRLIANSIEVATDDFVINVYHNGEKLPDSAFRLDGDSYGATVMHIQVDVHQGDWLVFEIANDRFRWNGSCGFAAGGIGPDGKVAFVSNTDGDHWSACDSRDKASHFISDADFMRDNAVEVPSKPWAAADDEVKKRCDGWDGKTIWSASNARLIWIKYNAVGGSATNDKDNNTAQSPVVSNILQAGKGPSAQLAKRQSSIKALYVVEQESGVMLGTAADLILTATPGEASGDTIPVDFATPVGSEMSLVLDDVLRAINNEYAHPDAARFEFTFSDKYEGHDGGSIGAALGTLMLSLMQGFDIDPQLAITGDVSADGKVRAIGGVSAKLRGAKDAGCTIVALPSENIEQLADTLVYSGPMAITNPQVIGISSLDSAAATARVDRDANLKQAIDLFSEVQQAMADSPTYIHGNDVQVKLQRVLQLCPQHLSAKLLLQYAQNRQRKRLTAGASEYYMFVALNSVVPTLNSEKVAGPAQVMPAAISQALVSLRRLRPMADLRIQPLIDACSELIQARSDFDLGNGTADMLRAKYQAFVDELTKLQADTGLMEKMLHQGV